MPKISVIDIELYENNIYNDLFDYVDYIKNSHLFINLDTIKVSNFFNKYLYFDLKDEQAPGTDEEY